MCKLRNSIYVVLFMFLMQYSMAQVGINTTTPDPSSMLDVSSTTKGMLTPRMTTAQKNLIASPANGLLVYDIDLKGFYYYDSTTSTWIRLASENKRNNYKLIKSVADLAAESIAGAGTSYLLDSSTFYEINGTINLVKPINLNNAYVAGLDANEDVLSFPGGIIFQGNTGGSIKNVTLIGGQAFNIIGPGIGTSSSLLVQNTIIVSMTTSVGSISGLGLYYGGVVQFIGNVNGITYSNIGNCLLDNQAWLNSNEGTFEKFTGSFGLIEKGSGFSTVNNADIALDVSTAGLAVGTGTLEGTVFSGATTAPGGYIKGYAAVSTYPGYNFSNAWTVNSPGIPRESDGAASGNLYLNRTLTYPNINFGTAGTRYKLPGTTVSTDLFRISDGSQTNRLVYTGQKTRNFTVSSTISMQASSGGTNTDLLFFFVKFTSAGVGTIVTSSETFLDTNSGYVQSFSVTGTVQLAAGEYVELHGSRINGTNKTLTFNSYNMSIR